MAKKKKKQDYNLLAQKLMESNPKYAKGGNAKKYTLDEIAKKGRMGDSELAHVNPVEAEILKSLGASGTINPKTGLREYIAPAIAAVLPMVAKAVPALAGIFGGGAAAAGAGAAGAAGAGAAGGAGLAGMLGGGGGAGIGGALSGAFGGGTGAQLAGKGVETLMNNPQMAQGVMNNIPKPSMPGADGGAPGMNIPKPPMPPMPGAGGFGMPKLPFMAETGSHVPSEVQPGALKNLGDARFGQFAKDIGGRKTDGIVNSGQAFTGGVTSLAKGDLKGFVSGMGDTVTSITDIFKGNRLAEKTGAIKQNNLFATQDAAGDVNVNKYGEVIDPSKVENMDMQNISSADLKSGVELGVLTEDGTSVDTSQNVKDLINTELKNQYAQGQNNYRANYDTLMEPFQKIGKSAIDTGKQMAGQFIQQKVAQPIAQQIQGFANDQLSNLGSSEGLQNIMNSQFGQGMMTNLIGNFGAEHGGNIPKYGDGDNVKNTSVTRSWVTPDQLNIMKTARQYLVDQGFGKDAYTQDYKTYLTKGGDMPVQGSYKPSADVLTDMSNFMADQYSPEQIMDFQNRLGDLTSTDKFQYQGGEEKDFGDGIFGPATASTLMDYHLGFLKKGLDGNPNMFDKPRKPTPSDYSQPFRQFKQGDIKTEAEDTAAVSLASGAVDRTFEQGGGVNNPGFMALPDNVQHKILKGMAEGGDLESMSEEEKEAYCAANPDRCGGYTPLRVSGSTMGNTGNVNMNIPLSGKAKLNLGYNMGNTPETTGPGASLTIGGGTRGSSLGRNTYGGVSPFAYYKGSAGGFLSGDEERTTRGTTSIEGGAGLGLSLGPRGGSSLNLYGSGGYRGGSGTPDFMKGPYASGNLGITRTGPWGTKVEPKGGIEYNFNTKQFMPKFGVGISFEHGGDAKNLPNEGLEALNKVRPDIVNKMGYEQGGDTAQYQGETPQQEDYVDVPQGYEGTFTIPGKNENQGGTIMNTPAEGMGNEEIIVNEAGPEVAEVAGGETFIYPNGKFSNEKKKLDKQKAAIESKLSNAKDEFEATSLQRMLEKNSIAQADLKQRIKDERAKKEASAKTKIDELLTSNVSISDDGKYRQGGKVKMLNNMEKEALVNMYMGGDLAQYAEGDEVKENRYRVKKEVAENGNITYKIYNEKGRAIRNIYSGDEAVAQKKLNNWLRGKGITAGMNDKRVAGINNDFDFDFTSVPTDSTGKDLVVEEQIQQNIDEQQQPADSTQTVDPFDQLVLDQKEIANDILANDDLSKEEKETELSKLDPFVMDIAKEQDEEFATSLQDFATVQIPNVDIVDTRTPEGTPLTGVPLANQPASPDYDPNINANPEMLTQDSDGDGIPDISDLDVPAAEPVVPMELDYDRVGSDAVREPTAEIQPMPSIPYTMDESGPIGPQEMPEFTQTVDPDYEGPYPGTEGINLSELFTNLSGKEEPGLRGPGDDIAEKALTTGVNEAKNITERMMQATDKAPNVGEDLMKQSRFDYDSAIENLQLANRGIKADINANMGTRMRGAERFRSIQDQEAYKQNIANDAMTQRMKADSLLANALSDVYGKKASEELRGNVYSDKFNLEQFDRDEAAKDAYFTALSQNNADAVAAGLLMGKNRNEMLTNMLMAQNTGAGNYKYNPESGRIEFVDPQAKEEVTQEEAGTETIEGSLMGGPARKKYYSGGYAKKSKKKRRRK